MIIIYIHILNAYLILFCCKIILLNGALNQYKTQYDLRLLTIISSKYNLIILKLFQLQEIKGLYIINIILLDFNNLMSTLPDIFIRYNSQALHPHKKIGGLFSINLRNSSFVAQQHNKLDNTGSEFEQEPFSKHRYSKSIGIERGHVTPRYENKSLNKSLNKQKQYSMIQQPGHKILSLNNKIGQSVIQTISNINLIKRQVMETCHISYKILEVSSIQIENIRKELTTLNNNLSDSLTQFKQVFTSEFSKIENLYKKQRRLALNDNKTIKKQMNYIEEESKIIQIVMFEVEDRLNKVLAQFN